ncbi:hypothetical protein F0562_003834 [Nyssa sinensis]|uniref:LysM domain-containing protein n=1 Tax=Nyssa sinensis TaxID=561372 RepID=A0A5J5C078_9ASTE|nr:hypothetical protein F0562_003834 [Nyssa sinensis]
MALSLPSLLPLLFLFLTLSASHVTAQSPASADTDFSCSPDSPVSCETYVTYRAKPPEFLNLGNISDLVDISRLDIAKSSNLVSEDAQLIPDQLLLLPITCNCNGTSYFSNVTYQVKKGDSLYLVSINAFENLTNYHLVEDLNPTLDPNNLHIGAEVVFPVLCKCPTKAHLEKGINHLITYVWQSHDDVLPVSSMFNASPLDIVTENNYRNFTAAVYLPVLIPVSQLPILSQPKPSPTQRYKPKHPWILIFALGTSGSLSIFLLGGLLVYIHLSLEKKTTLTRNNSSLETADLIQMKKVPKDENFEPKIIQNKLLPGISGYLGKPIMYDQKVIMEATMNLSDKCRIGGSVYRAMIDSRVFAVKKMKDATEELKILQKVNHANLVKLMGVSSDNVGDCFLVYEYAENGSLDKWLHPKSSSFSGSGAFLTWTQRDIRTSNILLNSSFKAKIANLSTARPATGSVMPKVDVFAFGVILLELLSGKKAMEIKENGEIVMLWKEISAILEVEEKREEGLRMWMDPNLESFYPIDGALNLAALAKACTSEKSAARPRMAEIVFNLSVLTHSSSEMYERSWTSSALEVEEAIQVISPVIAR